MFINIIFTEQLRTAASLFIERSFDIEKPNFNRCQEKNSGKTLRKGLKLELGLGLGGRRFFRGIFS